LQIEEHEILSIIGPANSGKTTFLRMLNRLNELQLTFKSSGSIRLDSEDIMKIERELLRKKSGYGFCPCLRLCLYPSLKISPTGAHARENNKNKLNQIVERALQQGYLWDEVKDRLDESAFKLSGGQQQRYVLPAPCGGAGGDLV